MEREIDKVWAKAIKRRRHKLRDRANTPGYDAQGNCIKPKQDGNERQAEVSKPPPDPDQSV